MIDPADAAEVTIPHCFLGSKEERAEDIAKFDAALKVEKHVEIFEDQIQWLDECQIRS